MPASAPDFSVTDDWSDWDWQQALDLQARRKGDPRYSRAAGQLTAEPPGRRVDPEQRKTDLRLIERAQAAIARSNGRLTFRGAAMNEIAQLTSYNTNAEAVCQRLYKILRKERERRSPEKNIVSTKGTKRRRG